MYFLLYMINVCVCFPFSSQAMICDLLGRLNQVYTCYPLFHQSCSSDGSELEPSFKPVLCLSTPKAPAPNQQKRYVCKWYQNISGIKGRTTCVKGWWQGYRDQQDEHKRVAKREHIWFTMFGCWYRFAKPWTSINWLIGLHGADAPRTSLLCHASEPKYETYCDIRPGSVLAL